MLRFDVRDRPDEALDAAVEAIRAGKCIVLPTDTLYGIGANAFDAAAVKRLLEAKKRGRDMPPPVLIAEPAMLAALADDLPYFAQRLADKVWPGALTLIIKAQSSLNLDLGETSGTIAVRVPDNDFTRVLLRRTGPLAVSSANVSGEEPATTVDAAIDMLGDSVAVYLDDGPAPGGVASTIVDLSSNSIGRIVRAGALSHAELVEWAPHLIDIEVPEPEPEVAKPEVEDAALLDDETYAGDAETFAARQTEVEPVTDAEGDAP